MSQLFTSDGQSIGVSASTSVLPTKTKTYLFQDGLVGSPCSPRDSQESSPTPQFKSFSSLVLRFLHSPTLTSIHDYWKNHSLDQTDLSRQSNVSAFQYAIQVGQLLLIVHFLVRTNYFISGLELELIILKGTTRHFMFVFHTFWGRVLSLFCKGVQEFLYIFTFFPTNIELQNY